MFRAIGNLALRNMVQSGEMDRIVKTAMADEWEKQAQNLARSKPRASAKLNEMTRILRRTMTAPQDS